MPLGFSIIGSTVTFDLFLRWATQGPLGPLVKIFNILILQWHFTWIHRNRIYDILFKFYYVCAKIVLHASSDFTVIVVIFIWKNSNITFASFFLTDLEMVYSSDDVFANLFMFSWFVVYHIFCIWPFQIPPRYDHAKKKTALILIVIMNYNCQRIYLHIDLIPDSYLKWSKVIHISFMSYFIIIIITLYAIIICIIFMTYLLYVTANVPASRQL